MLDLAFQDITHPDDLDADLKHVEQMLSGEIENFAIDQRYYCKDGSIAWINLSVSLVAGPPHFGHMVCRNASWYLKGLSPVGKNSASSGRTTGRSSYASGTIPHLSQ